MTTVRYLGHAAFAVEAPGFRGILDPFLTGNPKASQGADSIGELDWIFVTHGHGDHVGGRGGPGEADRGHGGVQLRPGPTPGAGRGAHPGDVLRRTHEAALRVGEDGPGVARFWFPPWRGADLRRGGLRLRPGGGGRTGLPRRGHGAHGGDAASGGGEAGPGPPAHRGDSTSWTRRTRPDRCG